MLKNYAKNTSMYKNLQKYIDKKEYFINTYQKTPDEKYTELNLDNLKLIKVQTQNEYNKNKNPDFKYGKTATSNTLTTNSTTKTLTSEIINTTNSTTSPQEPNNTETSVSTEIFNHNFSHFSILSDETLDSLLEVTQHSRKEGQKLLSILKDLKTKVSDLKVKEIETNIANTETMIKKTTEQLDKLIAEKIRRDPNFNVEDYKQEYEFDLNQIINFAPIEIPQEDILYAKSNRNPTFFN